MVRKTREQVFRELDVLGEDEVRRRLDAKPADVEEPGLIHEWLDAPRAGQQRVGRHVEGAGGAAARAVPGHEAGGRLGRAHRCRRRGARVSPGTPQAVSGAR